MRHNYITKNRKLQANASKVVKLIRIYMTRNLKKLQTYIVLHNPLGQQAEVGVYNMCNKILIKNVIVFSYLQFPHYAKHLPNGSL